MRVADAAGEKLLAATFAHDEQGLRSLCRRWCGWRLSWSRSSGRTGCWSSGCWTRGCGCWRCIPIRSRRPGDRFRVSGGKSDGFDAFVLCELARTDSHRFRVLEPDSDQTKALRALTRGREDLVGMRTALTNQLRAELERFWPGPLGLFTDLHGRISLAFLERYPSPADARGLGEARLAGFLARERYSGRQKPAELLAKLRRAAAARVGELELSTRRQLVLGLVAMIKSLNAQIKELERQLARTLGEHPDGEIFRSLFRDPRSVICAAELLAEIGDCRGRYPSRDSLAARRRPGRGRDRVRQTQSRVLPLGLQQAAARRVLPRWRTAPATGTPGRKTSTPQLSPAGTTTPARCGPSGARGAGSCGSCWQKRTPYDPARHRALQQHITVTIPTASGPVVDQLATESMAAGLFATNAPTTSRQQQVTAAQ